MDSPVALLVDIGGNVIDSVVDDKRRLAVSGKVILAPAPVPPGGTPITIAADNPLSLNSTHETLYTITTGKSFKLQQIVFGAEGDPTERGSKLEVIFRNASGDHVIERLYVTGFSQYVNYADVGKSRDGNVLSGNGTNKIVVRRMRLSGSSQEIDVVVRGFEA